MNVPGERSQLVMRDSGTEDKQPGLSFPPTPLCREKRDIQQENKQYPLNKKECSFLLMHRYALYRGGTQIRTRASLCHLFYGYQRSSAGFVSIFVMVKIDNEARPLPATENLPVLSYKEKSKELT